MQSFASLGHSVYRITFRRGSPQRIHFSTALTAWTLLALVVLAVAGQLVVFGGDLVDVVLYLFTWLSGLYLGVAFLSRKAPARRLRSTQQAALMILTGAHALLLLTAPFAAIVPWLPYAAAAVLGAALVPGFVNCVQYALACARPRALAWTLTFLFAVAAFYVTMQSLLAVAFS